MTAPSHLEIERALSGPREGRRLVMKTLGDYLASGRACAEPFVALSRFFCRLKSADSIVEKLARKGIRVRDATEILDRIPDLLGFRVIVANGRELAAIDEFVRNRFEVVRRQDWTGGPGESGEHGVEYSVRHHVGAASYPFELQLRTVLQHYWACQSFHLFHKQAVERGRERRELLKELAGALARAEELAERVVAGRDVGPPSRRPPDLSALYERVHLVVVEPGEQFAEHVTESLSGDERRDHEAIVARKMALYAAFPGAAIVECCCVNFLTFHLNEPLVKVPMDRLGRTGV